LLRTVLQFHDVFNLRHKICMNAPAHFATPNLRGSLATFYYFKLNAEKYFYGMGFWCSEFGVRRERFYLLYGRSRWVGSPEKLEAILVPFDGVQCAIAHRVAAEELRLLGHVDNARNGEVGQVQSLRGHRSHSWNEDATSATQY